MAAPLPSDDDAGAPIRAARGAGWALGLLTAVNLLNYLDRYVLSSLVEPIRADLHLSDTELGALATGFILVYAATSPLFGRLGDRRRRPPLIAAGVAIWSLATAAASFARGFGSLFVARSAVGVGEAAYGTIAPAMLADAWPLEKRGRVFAIFFAAIPVGSAAGYILGGLVGGHYGWRAAFLVAGLPGLLLALAVSFLPDPPRGGSDHEHHGAVIAPGSFRKALADLGRNRAYVMTVAGYAAYTFALGALAFWTPAFLERVRGMSRSDATVQFGAIVVATGFAGTFLGGWLADRLRPRTAQADLWVSGIATILAAPAALAAFTLESRPAYLAAIVVAEVLLFVSTGPANAAIVEAVAPGERATAVAFSILAIHLFGDVPSPPLLGAISEATSLGTAFRIVPVAILVSGLLWCAEARRAGRLAR